MIIEASQIPSISMETLDAKGRKRKQRHKQKQGRLDHVAVLDMETDPFDKAQPNERIVPFAACLYSDQFEPIVIWEEDEEAFISSVISAIEVLPDSYTIYAHNGGKFDFLFLISRLRGQVMFKGRGIMSAQIGKHELRDSFHIIPEKLAAYAKDAFDYTKMQRKVRHSHKDEIIKYLISDCRNLFDIVKAFLENFGFKISIGQAAMSRLRQHYKVKNVCEKQDEFLRRFFFGGRVECLQGKGEWHGDFKLYDVNSMYPFVMADKTHPVGSEYIKRKGDPGPNTIFLVIECISQGAFVRRADNGDTVAEWGFGQFHTTIWEYNVALKYDLISDVKIRYCVDCETRSTFEKFVTPLYHSRLGTKAKLDGMDESDPLYPETKREDIFYKLLMNNAYGKFAQNPRRFKEHYITEPYERPSEERETWGEHASVENEDYWIWSRPNLNYRFNNVGTAASITGAARAVLLEAIQNATDPIYCDTDSLICRNLANTEIHKTKLGAWDIEKEIKSVAIAGKKLYAYLDKAGKAKVRSKGASGLSYDDVLKLLAGEILETINPAPTLTKSGAQFYMKRRVRATAKERGNERNSQSIPGRKRQTDHDGAGVHRSRLAM